MDVINEQTLAESHVIHKTRADFSKRMPQDVVHLVQYDNSLPVLKVDLYLNGSSYTLPSTATVYIRWGKKDHTFVYKEVLGKSQDGKSVYVEVDDQMTYYFGNPAPILELKLGATSAGSSPLNVTIDRNPIQNGDIESHSEYPDLVEAVERAEEASADAQDAAERAEEAASHIEDLTDQVNANTAAITAIKDGTDIDSFADVESALDGKVDVVKSVTYSQLSTLKSSNGLVAGACYRITDYVTKVNGKVNNVNGVARSIEHPFDIIVIATSTNTLCEEASAILHSGDTYFANSNLKAWKLWYCFENDTTRFEWADSTNGKGVIYRMIDEFENDLPYDFKNIQFKRYKITATTHPAQSGLVGMYIAFDNTFGATYDTTDFEWYYTFSKRSDGSDLSLIADEHSSYTNSYYAKQVKIDPYLSDSPNYRGVQALNNIVMITTNIVVDMTFGAGSHHDTLVGNTDITYSYYGAMFRNNILIGEQSHNDCGECFENNIIGDETLTRYIGHNRTQCHFMQNKIISFYGNVFGVDCYNNTIGYDFDYNTIGNDFIGNTFGNSCVKNLIGNHLSNTTTSDDFSNNTIGNGLTFSGTTLSYNRKNISNMGVEIIDTSNADQLFLDNAERASIIAEIEEVFA